MANIYSIVPKEEYKNILKWFTEDDQPLVQEAMNGTLLRISTPIELLTTGEIMTINHPAIFVFVKYKTGNIDPADDIPVYEYGLVKLWLWATAVDREFLEVNVKPITGSTQNSLLNNNYTALEINVVT